MQAELSNDPKLKPGPKPNSPRRADAKRPGPKPTGNAKTYAERCRAYRERKKTKNRVIA